MGTRNGDSLYSTKVPLVNEDMSGLRRSIPATCWWDSPVPLPCILWVLNPPLRWGR